MQETRYGLQCAKGVPIKRDTEKFTSAFLEWKERQRKGDKEEEIKILQGMLALYRGNFMEDFQYGEVHAIRQAHYLDVFRGSPCPRKASHGGLPS